MHRNDVLQPKLTSIHCHTIKYMHVHCLHWTEMCTGFIQTVIQFYIELANYNFKTEQNLVGIW